jgi:uncharacterized protein
MSLIQRDAESAVELQREDDALDRLNRQVFEATYALNGNHGERELAMRYVLIARSLEPIRHGHGDRQQMRHNYLSITRRWREARSQILHNSFTSWPDLGPKLPSGCPAAGVTTRGPLPFSPSPSMIRLATFLRGKDQGLFELFARAGDNIQRAAELLDQMLRTFPESGPLAAEIRACEQEGDQITHELIDRMNKTFVTPIEREDVLQLASALDDVVDYIEEVADFLGLYGIEAPMDQAQELAEIIVLATRELAVALPRLQGFKDIHAQAVEIHRLENEGDRIVRGAITSLFKAGIDPIVVIRWKDIFERLEQAIDSSERAAYILEGIVIKNA